MAVLLFNYSNRKEVLFWHMPGEYGEEKIHENYWLVSQY
jgi:hypothetical protein